VNSTGPVPAWMVLTSVRKRGGRRHRSVAVVDRRKTGSKHHLIRDGHGTPLNVITTAANVNDATQTSPWSTVSRPSQAAPADHAAGPKPYSATRATTPTPTATHCASAESCPSCPA
jgi:hypothetical protein